VDDSGPIFDKEPEQKNSSTRSQQAATRNRGKVIINSPQPIYDQEPSMVDNDDDETSKDKEIDKLMALISLSNAGYKHQRLGNVAGARETVEMELACAKVRGDFLSYKMESQRSCNKYTQTINDLNQAISKIKNMLSAHQDTISILSKQKEAQTMLYKTREDKELEKVIKLENKVKVLDNIVYKTGQSVQTMNMLNNKCRTSFAKPEYLKKAKQANPRLYDIGCYNDNLALMLSPESDEDLKAQLQDKGIVVSDLKKLIEKLKGKYVDTKFEKSSVIRQPNAFKSQRPSALSKPTTFSNSFVRKDFSKSTSVTQNNVSNDFSKPVTVQTLPMNKKSWFKNTKVLAPGILNAETLNVKFVSAMYDKCVLIDKHDMCVIKSVDKPLKETVTLESNNKPRNFPRKLYERVSKTCSWWYPK
nr:hypothetical protein [Tanacetum cinerariifolium]